MMPIQSSSARFRRSVSVALKIAGAGLATLLLTSCEESRFGIPAPATKEGEEVLRLWQVSLYGAIALGAVVFGLLFFSLIRHRRKGDGLPKQTEGNVGLEFTYTLIPFIAVALLFAYGLKVQSSQTALKEPDVTVNVTAYQWNWSFDYPDEKVQVVGTPDSLPVMVLPVDKRVRFNLVAADVAHSFFVPRFTTKRDLIPGIRNEIEVTTQNTGFFIGHCAEYCGINHSQMNFRVRVVPQAEYDSWLKEEQAKGQAVAS